MKTTEKDNGKPNLQQTRMHSSRMRTVRCSGRLSCHAHPPAMHAPLCHACPFTMHAPFATHASPLCHAHVPCGQTDAYENITFPQLLLRAVMKPIIRATISGIVTIAVLDLRRIIYWSVGLVNLKIN